MSFITNLSHRKSHFIWIRLLLQAGVEVIKVSCVLSSPQKQGNEVEGRNKYFQRIGYSAHNMEFQCFLLSYFMQWQRSGFFVTSQLLGKVELLLFSDFEKI